MALRFFSMLEPKVMVTLANGGTLEFSSIDGIRAFFATDNEYIQNEFARFEREHRYNITEITAESFTVDYVDKKKAGIVPPSGAVWREEVSQASLTKPSSPVVSAHKSEAERAAAVNKSDIKTAPTARPQVSLEDSKAAPPSIPGAKPAAEVRPPTGKRAPRASQQQNRTLPT